MRLVFAGGFLTGAASMLALILWVMSDREPLVDMTFENSEGRYGFRGRMVEFPNA